MIIRLIIIDLIIFFYRLNQAVRIRIDVIYGSPLNQASLSHPDYTQSPIPLYLNLPNEQDR